MKKKNFFLNILSGMEDFLKILQKMKKNSVDFDDFSNFWPNMHYDFSHFSSEIHVFLERHNFMKNES